MGLISLIGDVVGGGYNALKGTVQSSIWKEYFESGDMSDGILMKRGERIIVNGGKNTKADNNLISSGSGIDVQEGQCMILVENGKIVEFCAEPGRYTYDASTAPSLYAGENKGLKALGKEILNQWSAGGQRFSTQRVYFINMGELIYTPIKWGCGDIAFHHTQRYATGIMELDITLKGNGQCTVQITDPVKFYTTIGAQKAGTDSDSIVRITDEGILSNLKSGIVDKIADAISTLGVEQQVAFTAIKSKSADVSAYINNLLSEEWAGKRGFGVASFTVNGSFIPTDEDREAIRDMQNSFNMSQNMNAANYDIQKTMAEGIRSAGENGGANGVFGVGMAMGAMGGANFGNLQQQPYQAPPTHPTMPVQPVPTPVPTPPANTWKCSCGTENNDMFCRMCGSKKPDANGVQAGATWTCTCGKVNPIDSRFCPSCGSKKPVVKKLVCDKCGWTPQPGEEVRFCPKCGDIFDDKDVSEE